MLVRTLDLVQYQPVVNTRILGGHGHGEGHC